MNQLAASPGEQQYMEMCLDPCLIEELPIPFAELLGLLVSSLYTPEMCIHALINKAQPLLFFITLKHTRPSQLPLRACFFVGGIQNKLFDATGRQGHSPDTSDLISILPYWKSSDK